MEILSEILKKLYGLSEDQANVLIYADDKKETLKDNVISEILALQEKKINEKKEITIRERVSYMRKYKAQKY